MLAASFSNLAAKMNIAFPDISVFPADYAQSRQLWLAASEGLGGRHESHPCAGSGPHGEALFSDSLWLGHADAGAVLVILAGTHGVEGFVGSAVQIDLLRQMGDVALGHDQALLLIHGLTPWGYAWCRRCDADGVDLNRNGVDFSAPLPENAAFEQLRPAFYQDDAKRRWQRFQQFAEEHGRVALEQAISGGQYSDAQAPFFGGRAVAHGRKLCEQLISQYGLQQRRLAVIDIHSGLGPYGYGEIICDHAPESPAADTARRWYGDAVTLPLAGTGHSVPKLGLLDYLWHAVMDASSCYVTLEFGSYSTECLFEVLLQDHLLWAQPGTEASRRRHAEQMRRHFCPDDPAWRELVLFRARQVIGQALAGLAK